MTLSFKDVAEILKIIDASSCEEVVLDLGGVRLEVRRRTSSLAPSSLAPHAAVPAAPLVDTSRPSTPAAVARTPVAPPPAATAPADGMLHVRAPMVGSFYRCLSPKEKPFAEVGQRVKRGDPLCLIEVMKLYNTITAPADGVVAAIAPDDGALVQFDQLLITLKPA